MTLERQRTLLRLVDLLYSCVNHESQWNVFLESLGDSFRASAVGITTNTKLNLVVRVDPSELAKYQTYYGAINPWMGRRTYADGESLLSEEVLPVEAYRKSAFYNEWGKRNLVTHAVGGAIHVDRDIRLFLSINRGDSQGPYDEEDREFAQLLLPHLRRAANLHDRLMVMHDRQWVLDSLAFPVMHVSQDRTLLWANRAGEELLREARGIFLRNGKLGARITSDDSALQTTLGEDRCVFAARPRGFGGWLRVTQPDDGSEISIFIAQAPSHTRKLNGIPGGKPAFILFVAAQSVDHVLVTKRLRSTWRLTSAEAALALELLEAETLQEAAERLHVSRNTVKTQLSSIYEKMGVRRQSELIRKLLSVVVIGCTNGR